MVRETPAQQLLLKKVFGKKSATGGKDDGPAVDSRKSLMFSAGPQQADIMSEFLALQSGVGHFAHATVSTTKHLGEHEAVFIKIDLLGVHICETDSKDSLIVEFGIEEIVKYSQNRAKRRFTFSRMDSAGLVREYKFCSEQYFEIFEALGRAIAVVIKIKGKDIGKSHKEDRDAPASLRVGHELPEAPSSNRSSLCSRESSGGGFRRRSRVSGYQAKSLGDIFSREETEPGAAGGGLAQHSDEASHKASLAKYYIEARYHTRVSEPELSKSDPKPSPDGSTPTTPPKTRRWKDQLRYDYMSVHKARYRSDTLLTGGDEEATKTPVAEVSSRHSVGSRLQLESSNHTSQASIRTPAPHIAHLKTASDPFLTVSANRSARTSVLSIFGKEKEAATRQRSKSDRPLLSVEPLNDVIPLEATLVPTDKEKAASVSGFRRMASMMTMRRKGSSVFPSSSHSRSPSFDALAGRKYIRALSAPWQTHSTVFADDKPKVAITTDEDGKEVLIKNLTDAGYQVVAGTVDALIGDLYTEPVDLSFVEIFLLTFRHFLAPQALLEALSKRFLEGCGTAGPKASNDDQQLAIAMLVKKWAGAHAYDFLDTSTMAQLNSFLTLVQSTQYASYSTQIRSLVHHELEKYSTAAEEVEYSAAASSAPYELVTLLREFDFLAQSSRRIAQQLTLVDSRLFRAIRPEEFTLWLWDSSGIKLALTSNLQTYINRFNRVGYWVATVICSYEERQKRTEALEMFIKIATKSLESGNFNTAMAILSGLNTTPVSRLKKSFAHLPSRATTAYEELETALSYRSNYKNYRELEEETRPPLLPFMGLVIKDLTFLNDGNQKTLVNGLINFEKMREVWALASRIREWQRGKFPWPQDDEIIIRGPGDTVTLHSYCENPPCLSEEQLLSLSKSVEPPDLKDNNSTKIAAASLGRSFARPILVGDPLLEVLGIAPPKVTIEGASNPAGFSTLSSTLSRENLAYLASSLEQEDDDVQSKKKSKKNRDPDELSEELADVIKEYDALARSRSGSPDMSLGVASPRDDGNRRTLRSSSGERRRSLIERGGGFRRKLSAGGLGVVLGWWKKEEEENATAGPKEDVNEQPPPP
ncbi:ras guanine nucleotide exchange factor domain-containing protein [Geranomyces variabilis]|nr:ras guanine nucleotide exchange factor domain-containing protein [Geranomyces variabilis]KAJ3138121.1 hypothetical protein HDU90_001600 [Geranomyces variabilis]